jgi:hypothetical protein
MIVPEEKLKFRKLHPFQSRHGYGTAVKGSVARHVMNDCRNKIVGKGKAKRK